MVRERIATLQARRITLNQRLATTADVVQQETDTLLQYSTLLEQLGAFYAAATDAV